jgi:1-pyrroline-4-hydroxy-2-carboxylate deaminase
VQQEFGVGSARVRGPRMEIVGAELQELREAVELARKTRPKVAKESTEFK